MRWGAWVPWLLVGMVLLRTGEAHAADTAQIRKLLRVEAGATCLTAEQLALEIEPLLDDVQVPEGFLFEVEGSAIDAQRAQLRIVRDERVVAERAFDPGPDRCGHFHAAVGLTIALAINAAREEERKHTRDWSVAAAGLLSYGVVPELAPGVELHLRRAFGEHALVRAGLVGVMGFDVSLAADTGGFDATLIAARVDGCGRTRLASRLRGAACFGLLGGALHAAGQGVMRSTSSTVPWLALSGGAQLELQLSERWSLELGAFGSVLLHRVEVGTEDPSGARSSSRTLNQLAFLLGLGPVYCF